MSTKANLEEMDKFLEPYNLLTQNHNEIKNPNRLITSKDLQSVIKNLSKNKSLGLDGLTGKFH